MGVGIFQVAGPVMIGPSSSHTAGAARLGRMCRQFAGVTFDRVEFQLHGSFAKTGKGHGTDKALAAGVLGMREDDENLPNVFSLCAEAGIEVGFSEVHMEGRHENSVRAAFYNEGSRLCVIEGSSVGGGEIVIVSIDGYETEIKAEYPTIFIRQRDQKGVLSFVTTALAEGGHNIATMKVSRKGQSEDAVCIIELDEEAPKKLLDKLRQYPDILSVTMINP